MAEEKESLWQFTGAHIKAGSYASSTHSRATSAGSAAPSFHTGVTSAGEGTSAAPAQLPSLTDGAPGPSTTGGATDVPNLIDLHEKSVNVGKEYQWANGNIELELNCVNAVTLSFNIINCVHVKLLLKNHQFETFMLTIMICSIYIVYNLT